MKNINIERLLWATIFIVVGLLLLASSAGIITDAVWTDIWRLWPIFILVPGIVALFNKRFLWGLLLSIVGSALLIANYTEIDVWSYMFPILIILFGISFLFKPNMFNNSSSEKSTENSINEVAVFGGLEKKIVSKDFQGGQVDAVFGGGTIDLRSVEIKKDKAKLEVNAVFGGLEIWVDTKKYKVVSSGTGVFGGWSNKSQESDIDSPVLEITGSAVFGGIEIK